MAIKFDTFPYAQYGMAEGVVQNVSPNSFTIEEEARNPTVAASPLTRNSSDLFYRARILIQRVAAAQSSRGIQSRAGNAVSADIKVGKRTVLQYMLGVVLPVADEAMREP